MEFMAGSVFKQYGINGEEAKSVEIYKPCNIISTPDISIQESRRGTGVFSTAPLTSL